VLTLLSAEPATEVARRFTLDADRVRLLPAGLLILEAAAERFGAPLEVARGGLREGLLLEVSSE
jgi:exopolyphosphatase / guanosine-5'-triphosphate,3'-diphosphate pyrophosphatase